MAEFDPRHWESIGALPVVEDESALENLPCEVTAAWWRGRVSLWRRRGGRWQPCPPDEIGDGLEEEARGRPGAAIEPVPREACGVFVSDDGSLADLRRLAPLCGEKGVPFVLAIVRDWVGKRDGGGYLDRSQLQEMEEMGCELVGHSASHPNLAILGAREIEREVEDSILWMRDQGWAARHFVYPYGGHRVAAERVIGRLCESGCLVTGGVASPPFQRTRVPRHAFGSFFHGGISTFEGYRLLVDEAVREKRMLVWMLHPGSPEHDANQQAILVDLIDYMRETGMRITNLTEAWSRHGNLWESPPGYGRERVLDSDGLLWKAGSRVPLGGGEIAARIVDSRQFAQAQARAREWRGALGRRRQ